MGWAEVLMTCTVVQTHSRGVLKPGSSWSQQSVHHFIHGCQDEQLKPTPVAAKWRRTHEDEFSWIKHLLCSKCANKVKKWEPICRHNVSQVEQQKVRFAENSWGPTIKIHAVEKAKPKEAQTRMKLWEYRPDCKKNKNTRARLTLIHRGKLTNMTQVCTGTRTGQRRTRTRGWILLNKTDL